MFKDNSLYFDDLIDVESIELDFFEIVTPGGIDRRVETLDDAWKQLVSDTNDSYVKSEYSKWTKWSKTILDLSWISKGWATGILKELDDWKARYTVAYNRVKTSNKLAPSPESFQQEKPFFESPIFWVVAGIGLAAGIYFYAQYKK